MQALFAKHSKPASDEVVDKTVKALIAKGHKAVAVNSKEEAVKYLQSLVPEGATLSSGYSTTLHEIGWVDHLKAQTKWTDYKSQILAAQGKNDWKTAGELQKKVPPPSISR